MAYNASPGQRHRTIIFQAAGKAGADLRPGNTARMGY
jgi:hypothetical protein